jgi:hypothetical protein
MRKSSQVNPNSALCAGMGDLICVVFLDSDNARGVSSHYRNDALFFSSSRISCTTFSSASEIERASAR